MANYFVDSTTGDNGDTGATMDLAWATLEYAMESGALSAGDIVWVRRVHIEYGGNPTSDIVVAYDGTPANPLRVIGWPRASDTSISSASWTNGSTTVDLIVGLSMDREQHLGRFIAGPDGFNYLITQITDSNTIVIDREYTGASVTLTDGAATIVADEDYDTAQAIDDSGWTIDVATWTADADDVPELDFKDQSFTILLGDCMYFANIGIRDSADGYGNFLNNTGIFAMFRGCLFAQTNNKYISGYSYRSSIFYDRCIITGSGVGGNQQGCVGDQSSIYIRDSALYNGGGWSLYLLNSAAYLENVNIGVEVANADDDIAIKFTGHLYGRDVILGNGAGDVLFDDPNFQSRVSIENFGKSLGAHKQYVPQGSLVKMDVVAGSGDPEKRTGGSDSVLEILYNSVSDRDGFSAINETVNTTPIFDHEFEVDASSKSYRFYVQAVGAVTAAQLWIVAEYVTEHDDASQYVFASQRSDEAISARSDAADWSQYIEVTGIQPAVASKVRIKCYCSYYHATNKIYIDPLVEIT